MTTTIRRRTLLGAGAAVAFGAACTRGDTGEDAGPPPPAGTFLLRNVRVFDGDQLTDADSVLVADGLIEAVDRDLPNPDAVTAYDGGGATLLPGLIDAHIHYAPPAGDDPLRFGTTTALDMHTIDLSWLPDAAAARTAVGPTDRPDVWSAGIGVTVPDGWPDFGQSTLSPEADRAATARFVADRVAEGSDYVKIFIEDGSASGRRPLPTLTEAQVRTAVEAAHDHDLLAVVHVSTVAGAVTAAHAGADLLAHVPWDEPISAADQDLLLGSGIGVVATLSVIAAGCGPEAEAIRTDPRITPYLTEDQGDNLRRGHCLARTRDQSVDNVAALYEAGVPILAGTDAPNAGTTYGASMFGELALLVSAGLSPAEALHAATAGPADAFGLADRGRIAAGLRADLLLVNGDPTSDIDAIPDLLVIWKNGHPVDRTPAAG